jgi:hypothetical protein
MLSLLVATFVAICICSIFRILFKSHQLNIMIILSSSFLVLPWIIDADGGMASISILL